MTGSTRRHASFRRALVALGAAALLVLLALATLLVGAGLRDRPDTVVAAAHGVTHAAAVGDRDHPTPPARSAHQVLSTRAQSIAFAVPAAAVVLAAWILQRLRLARSGRLRTLRVAGLPPGRAPPAPRIA